MHNLKEKIIIKAKLLDFNGFNIENPKTWCEKIQWLQIHDDINLRSSCADKIKIHEYSIKKLNKDICVPILKIYKSPNKLIFKELPDKFVLKCNHGWNMNIVIDDKTLISQTFCKRKLREWLNVSFGENTIEPHYLKINRQCFAEQHIGKPLDYKFWCFNGKPLYCTVNSNIGNNGASNYFINWYNMDWNFMLFCRCDHPYNPEQLDDKPNNFELMKSYAEVLSKDFKFVRVDFYEVDNVVYLGELTFTPATGFIRWTDPTIDRMFGDLITL